MFKFVLTLNILLFTSFSFGIVSILSNEWFIIGLRKADCSSLTSFACLFSKYENALRFGIWYMCPNVEESPNMAWVFDTNLNRYCLNLMSNSRTIIDGDIARVMSSYLGNAFLVDVKPAHSLGQIRLLNLVGTTCLFSNNLILIFVQICIWLNLSRISKKTISSATMYQDILRKHLEKYDFITIYLELVLVVSLVEFSVRLASFCLFVNLSENYLNNYLNVNTTQSENTLWLSKYKMDKASAYWLAFSSLGISLLILVIIGFYVILCRILKVLINAGHIYECDDSAKIRTIEKGHTNAIRLHANNDYIVHSAETTKSCHNEHKSNIKESKKKTVEINNPNVSVFSVSDQIKHIDYILNKLNCNDDVEILGNKLIFKNDAKSFSNEFAQCYEVKSLEVGKSSYARDSLCLKNNSACYEEYFYFQDDRSRISDEIKE